MHAILVPIGSAGDVHPFLGLGTALRARGHGVTVVTNGHFARPVRRAGLEFVEMGTEEDYQTVLNDPGLWEPARGFKLVIEWAFLKGMRPAFEIIKGLYRPGETLVAAQASAFGARIAQEALGVPLVTVDLQPSILRSASEPPVLYPLPLSRRAPAAWNHMLYWLADTRLIDPLIAPEVNAFRAELGLPQVRRFLGDWWHSPERILGLFPAWFAPPQADWPAQTSLAGFPLYDESELTPPSAELEAFLSEGPAPLVFTPGSAMRHGHSFFNAAIEASARLGRRAALLTRYRDQLPEQLPDGVRWFDSVPFSRIFPRAAAVVHHGGIGTTAQGLAAAVPQLVMPMAHDQHDNAARLDRLGVGAALAPRRFRGPAVAKKLEGLLGSRDVADRCQACAERVRHDHGLDAACRILEQSFHARPGVTQPT